MKIKGKIHGNVSLGIKSRMTRYYKIYIINIDEVKKSCNYMSLYMFIENHVLLTFIHHSIKISNHVCIFTFDDFIIFLILSKRSKYFFGYVTFYCTLVMQPGVYNFLISVKRPKYLKISSIVM